MAFNITKRMPTPEKVLENVPLPADVAELKKKLDKELANVITGADKRFLVIIGPCSADNEEKVAEYTEKLAKVYARKEIKEKLFIVPRIYTGKPRTTGEGYKGVMHNPDPTKEETDMEEGISAIRRMHIRCMKECGMLTADEMLYPGNLPYCQDIVGYIAIGARSVENQQHRLTSSGIDGPVGMKNPTSGDLSVMFNAIKAAQSKHSFVYKDDQVETTGNPLSHAILRGSNDRQGRDIPNYHYEDLANAVVEYKKKSLQNPMIVVDVNHANSGKKYKEQMRITKDILHTRKNNIKYGDGEIAQFVRGLMIESYLIEGRQDVTSSYTPGQSVTDPCLGFEDTEWLLEHIAENV